MNQNDLKLGQFGFAGDDHVVPFDVETLDVRGRAVQIGPMLDQILSRHEYPEPVGRLLAEVIVLTVLLGSSLKFSGKFIVQTRTDGPVDMLVADYTTPGSVRAYARFDEERLKEAEEKGETTPERLLGVGILALTVDQGAHMQRYQGIVQLDGSDLESVARTYFRQSEQIPTEVKMGVARIVMPGEGGQQHWRAGGLLLQFTPTSPERSRMSDISGGDGDEENTGDGQPDDNAWQEALALAGTIEPGELVDPSVGVERLLYRLFHEQGVRAYDGTDVIDDCSCSREKIRGILDGFTAEEIEQSTEDGEIHVNCEFCSKSYSFDAKDFDE
ncbi:Hsp33 family molecular chaperone [Nitratireductor sp. CH_MIT9313-5]|uniref:Hsp33 family molecular chaperone n=1 Tax=Nitratireductor sp. CH_MIT9313-5 TaxID=3107764 RepID=UPI00300BB4FC